MEPQEHDPKRRSIFVDGQYAVGLHEETIILARLKVGMAVDGPRLMEVLRRDEAKRAWDDALGILAAAARSRREVEQRLRRRYGEEVAAEVTQRLANGGWLDDAEYARSYCRSHSEFGARRLLQELARRGVPREVAGSLVQELTAEVDSVSQAREAAAVRLDRMTGVDRDTAQRRLSGFLARRGYGFDVIGKALQPLLQDLPRAAASKRRSGFGQRWEGGDSE